MNIYEKFHRKGTVGKLLNAGKLGQRGIKLVKTVRMPAANPWDDTSWGRQEIPLVASASGPDQNALGRQLSEGGPVVSASDLSVIAEPPDCAVPEIGDDVIIDGKAHKVLWVEWTPESGDPKIMVEMLVR